MDPNGKLVYLEGSHFWDNLQDSGSPTVVPYLFDYDKWLDFLQANHHNYTRLWGWEQSQWVAESTTVYQWTPNIYLRTGPGTALDGKPKFDVTKFNQAYFDRMRQRIIDAGNRGIYVSIQLFDGWSVDWKAPWGGGLGPVWHGHPFNKNNNINGIDGDPHNTDQGDYTEDGSIPAVESAQETYVRKVIDTVNDLPNVLYEICNECADGTWNPTDSTQWQYHLIDLIHSYEATKPYQHPVGISEISANDAPLFASHADWVSIHDSGDLNSPYISTGAKVVVVDTDHVGGTADRTWVWKSFMHGKNPLFMDQYDDSYKLNGGGYNMNNPNDVSLRANLGYTLAYANRMNLSADIPHGELTSTGYALANPTSEFLVYAPAGGQFTVNLSAASGTLKVEWFNPSDGTAASSGTVTGGATRSFTAPFSGDAVLYLCKTTGAPPPTPFPGNFFTYLPFIQGSALSQSSC